MLQFLIPAAASLLGGAISSGATKKASGAAEKAAAENARLQREQYEQTRTDLQPYTQGGYRALGGLEDQLYGPQPGSPDYAALVRNNAPLAELWADPNAQAAWGGDIEAYGRDYAERGQAAANGWDVPTVQGPLDQWSERPTGQARPTDYGAAPDFSSFFDPNPTQQYRDELASSTRSINARAGMGGGYFSGARGTELQSNADKLYRADEDRRFSRANALYQSALGQFNTNRGFANSNYDVDASRSDARFDADRGYATGRVDNRTSDLFNLLGIGASATSALTSAGQNNANQQTQNNNALASTRGNAAIAGANNVNSLLGNAMTTYGLFGGGQGGGQGGSTPAGQNALSKVSSSGWAW